MDVVDAVGETTNMISGDSRHELGKREVCLKADIPTVATGKRHNIKHMTSGPIIAITL